MKKLFITTVLAVGSIAAYGQGTFNFNNFSPPGVDAPVSKGAGGLVDSVNYYASVSWAQGTVSDPTALALIPSSATPFFGAGFPGYFFNSTGISPGATVNGVITVQVQYWNNLTGNSFAAARNNFTPANPGEWGQSGLFQITLGNSATALPADLVGLGPIQLTINPVPEPSTLALIGLGTGALLFFRRRK